MNANAPLTAGLTPEGRSEAAAGADMRHPILPPSQTCSRCIFDSNIGFIEFDEESVCNYCHQVDALAEQFQTGTPAGERELERIIDVIKDEGRGKKYDCIIGVSGGTDSSYLLLRAVEWGLRPLAVHYDNTWNASVATENIRRVTRALDVDLQTHVVDNRESDDLFRAFFRAGVPEFDAPTDIGFAQTLRVAAAKVGVRYLLEGHSFKAEGLSPISNYYFDGRYVQDVHAKHGDRKRLKTFPNMSFWSFLKWIVIYRQKIIRPLWYIDYTKANAREVLTERTGWQYYGGHHLENRASCFLHQIWNPEKFGGDLRHLTLGAEVRAGAVTREEALEMSRTPMIPDPELVAYVKKRLGMSDEEYDKLLYGTPSRTFRDYETYKSRFERLRPIFYLCAKANLVPMSFYLKYCFPIPERA